MVYAPDLDALLADGHWRTRWLVKVFVEARVPAPVVLPTGRVVASDGFAGEGDEPFTVAVAPGTYPMFAWVAELRRFGRLLDRRNAALELRVSEEPTVDWEMALTAGESVDQLDEGDYRGFTVDSGCATLADAEACAAIRRWEFARVESVYIPRPLPQEPAPGYVTAVVDPATGANLSVVGAGWGDGAYPVFIGRDADGGVTRFVADFMLMNGA